MHGHIAEILKKKNKITHQILPLTCEGFTNKHIVTFEVMVSSALILFTHARLARVSLQKRFGRGNRKTGVHNKMKS